MTEYLDLADFLLIAEAVTGVPAETLARVARLELAESALAAPQASFGGVEFYPDIVDQAAVLCARLAWNHPCSTATSELHGSVYESSAAETALSFDELSTTRSPSCGASRPTRWTKPSWRLGSGRELETSDSEAPQTFGDIGHFMDAAQNWCRRADEHGLVPGALEAERAIRVDAVGSPGYQGCFRLVWRWPAPFSLIVRKHGPPRHAADPRTKPRRRQPKGTALRRRPSTNGPPAWWKRPPKRYPPSLRPTGPRTQTAERIYRASSATSLRRSPHKTAACIRLHA